MSSTVFYVAIVVGGLVLGALCTLLLPKKRTGNIFAAMWAGAFGAAVIGLLITEVLGATNEVGLAAIAVGPLYAFSPVGDFFSGGIGNNTTWGDSGGGDCGDGGGGDGGGGCD